MAANLPMPLPPVLAYARLSRQAHELIAQGKGDSEEAEALADFCDAPWYTMRALEQERMRGLSVDLYALQEGGPKRVEMPPEELAKWQEAGRRAYASFATGDVDAMLALFRKPIPFNLPYHFVRYQQARCWEKLGDLETALVFMKAAEKLEPSYAVSVLALL